MKRFLFALMLFALFSVRAFSIDKLDFNQQLDAIGIEEIEDNIPDNAQSLLNEINLEKFNFAQMLKLAPKDFFALMAEILKNQIKAPMVVLFSVFGIVVLCAMLSGLKDTINHSSIISVFDTVSILCICVAIIKPVIACINVVIGAIEQCSTFMITFIPIWASTVTASGQPVTATTYNIFLFSVCQVISQVAAKFIVPMMCVYLALSIMGSLSSDFNISGCSNTIKTIVSFSLGLLLSLFVGVLSVQTFISSGADSVTAKTAKFVIGSFIPVVGGMLSDAYMAAQGCIKFLKTTIGAYGIIVALLTFLPVLLQLVLWYFTVNISTAAADLFEIKQVSGLLKSISSALSVLMAIIVFYALLIIISISIILVSGLGL